jgi:hypothetical protein
MVQIDIPAAFIASLLFLDIGKEIIKKQAAASPSDDKPKIYYKFLWRTVFFAGFAIAPAGIYLLGGWPGWEQMYWTQRVEEIQYNWFNALLPTLFLMAIVFCAYLGHVIGYNWIVNGKEKYLRPTYLGLLALVVAIVGFNWPAPLVVSNYKEYWDAVAAGIASDLPSVFSNHMGFTTGWLIIMIYFLIAFLYMLYILLKEKKEQA